MVGERMFEATRAHWKLALAGLGLVVAVLTGLVAGGRLTSIDQWAVDQLMPALQPKLVPPPSHAYRGYFLPFGGDTAWWVKILDTWTYPCSVSLSLLAVVIGVVVLRRRGRPTLALAWAGAWLVGNALEVIGKGLVTRPELYGTSAAGLRVHLTDFDQSFPSGHSIRCVIVAGIACSLWRSAIPAIVVWALLVFPALLLSGAHVLSDIVGGSLIGLMILLAALAAGEWDRTAGSRPPRGHPRVAPGS